MTERIFISSVQKELAAERRAVADFIRNDPLLRRFFEVFLFEELPARDRRADHVYLDEVGRAAVYVGIFGDQYGLPGDNGLSPTAREFEKATALGVERLIFVKGADDSHRDPKMKNLIDEAASQLVRRRFETAPDLVTGVYASLVDRLERIGEVSTKPFDAKRCHDATLDDISEDKLGDFLARAQRTRGFVLEPDTSVEAALTHLNLLDDGRPTNAGILLFGHRPQRFLITSEVKCLHFHGTEVRKPIPSYQVYKGTVFELVDQAVDFVMSKITRAVGTRAEGPMAPVTYELPAEAVGEAIVNAIAHRDYASNASVQVMLFSDRLEVWNPGRLPPPLTLESLREPHSSIPRNPLIAESLFLAKYIERAGSGTLDMIALCADAGLRSPEFLQQTGQFIQRFWRPTVTGVETAVTGPSTQSPTQSPTQLADPVVRLLLCLGEAELSPTDLRESVGIKHRPTFRANYMHPALEQGLVEPTIPDRPTSRLQKYRITPKGRALLEADPAHNPRSSPASPKRSG